ncbi:hypothetical protein, partial [Burkholderia sp. SIMBA_024]|uniref:hypothetical protein n=1 Tax=Burkholderia sp. SIMBA_024 TaxID=3085768 RepID=UPI00397BC092
SDLHEQRFTSRFTGTEFFLADHQIHGDKVFPGVGYLEMARAAVDKALGKRDATTAIMLKNIVWTQPLVINDGVKDVHIG